jgi:hypothetical protein
MGSFRSYPADTRVDVRPTYGRSDQDEKFTMTRRTIGTMAFRLVMFGGMCSMVLGMVPFSSELSDFAFWLILLLGFSILFFIAELLEIIIAGPLEFSDDPLRPPDDNRPLE